MSMFRLGYRSGCALVASLVIAMATVTANADQAPGLGQPLDASAIEQLNFNVFADGSGLPQGSGTVADGKDIYVTHCQACHGENGEGGMNGDLTGGTSLLGLRVTKRTIGTYWPYATTVFDYIRRAMPYTDPTVLDNDQVYAVTAYLLAENDIIDDDTTLNAENLATIEMPNHENFVWKYPQD